MDKMRYAKPVTEVEVQAYFENDLLGISDEQIGPIRPEGGVVFREGVPVSGGTIGNPSFISGSGNSSYLWEEEESDY